ncbi:MAG: Gfo/Idh/MocA family oxidoreductase [Myxococcota bacterium]
MAGRGVAVVGAGYWGQNLVRNMAQLDRLAGICDASEAVRKKMARTYPNARVTADLDELLADPDVGAVMVVVPSSRHHEVAKKALLAGKHVFVEKPIALKLSDGEDLVRTAEERDLRLMVGHLLLYHPCVEWLKRSIDAGDLGDVLYLNALRLNLGKVRSDENAMWSLAPHDISVALYLLGASPSHVTAQGFCYLQRRTGIEDVVFLTLRFADGRAAQIHVSWLDPDKKRQIDVVGTRKMVTFDDMAASEKIRVMDKGVDGVDQLNMAPSYESYGDLLTLRQGDIHMPYIPMREPLRAECEHFLHCVDTGERPRSDGRSAVEVLEVLQAGQQSLQAGGVPVALSPSPGGLRGGRS